ncbi:hypothetical protein [Azohydromonas lata]|uniref:Uncharacterized protein n=1 Tax=Azohydromonas lata TaxID=45677 RepID=A0ABU5IDZ8_9BURK|nr:hypothetical protein [Azohydromonas lata]MDZ5456885.1 hypothetical protein [Azohydromonas lata]
MPVLLDGRVAYSLGVGLTTEKFDALFTAQRLPPNWIVGIVDEAGKLSNPRAARR